MARRDKLWSFCAFPSRLDRVRRHAETNYGQSAPFCHPEAIVPNGAQRQIMVILRLSIQAQSCSMTRRGKLWSLYALLSSRGDRVRWRAETNYGHSVPFHPGLIMSDGTQRQIMVILRPFVIQRRSCPMAAETNYGHPHAFAICKTQCVINAQRQIMVILRPLSFRSSKSSDKHAETNYGHSAPFVIQEQQVE